ncbi:RagB/SusD family nutrient uptake outer membrane protein [Chryseobacterium sp. SN22]|uniref:RagB/SusD family nutrient uptake outer membrane protein n=1 Tax=Chryseobacterium sp. SN22 TaxID=2606431 RepID=UPI0011EF0771|nr:RagB/SusD family nutrient uptake outer membrane protein [Chryseobacterium sp. SN22]KAA0126794.1 RagB/SusD family nutrient uptake outer membrane protein [Chryseobacterium sp. SN22]
MKPITDYLIYLLLMLAALLGMAGCEKYLETDFPNNQLATELIFEDEKTADAALAGLYAALWTGSVVSGTSDGSGALLGTYADDVTCVFTGAGNPILDIYNNQPLATNSTVSLVWTNAYQQVYMANSIIEGTAGSKSLSQPAKDRIIGEALLIRSLVYFYLYNIYGEVPYTATTDYVYNSNLNRMPKNDFLVKLETDISEAVNLLPASYRNAERIYVNKAAGYVLLAKMKMLAGKWQEAELLCRTIIQNGDYVFQSDLSKVFQKTGKHLIWQLKPKNNTDPTNEALLYNFVSVPTSFVLNPDLISSFSAGDLRWNHYFTAVVSGSQTNYKQTKYKVTATSNTTEYSVVYRLEDVYLMLAESLNRQNKTGQAVPFINHTRQRAGLTALGTSISQSQAMDEMKNERRREFFAEHGSRFLDLKRWGQLDQLKPVKPNWKPTNQFFPLPQKEMLLNKNLTPQNDGY